MAAREFSRRDLVRMSVASAFGVAACPWLPRLAAAADKKKETKACIVLWMSGGPSQMDTWDLKPGHKNGGPYKERETAVPGLKISEHLPKLAEAAKHVYVFQRTPSTVSPRDQRPTDPAWFGQISSQPGWHTARQENFVATTLGERPEVESHCSPA